jgi:hypothetical protein
MLEFEAMKSLFSFFDVPMNPKIIEVILLVGSWPNAYTSKCLTKCERLLHVQGMLLFLVMKSP